MTTCGGIPETGTAPLGGRFLLVTNAQENGCSDRKHTFNDLGNRKSPPCRRQLWTYPVFFRSGGGRFTGNSGGFCGGLGSSMVLLRRLLTRVHVHLSLQHRLSLQLRVGDLRLLLGLWLRFGARRRRFLIVARNRRLGTDGRSEKDLFILLPEVRKNSKVQ